MVQLLVAPPHLSLDTPTLALQDVTLERDVSQIIDRIPREWGETRLIYGGKQLVANRTLADYGVTCGSTIHAVGRLRGGAQLGKVVKGRSQVKKKSMTGKPREYADLQAKFAKMQEMDATRQQAMAAKAELMRRLEQQEKNSKTNQLKIQNQWRKIMRLAKVESLRKDIEILSQNHERDVDRKDAIIQMLDRDLEEAEDQFQMAMRAHLTSMDQLIYLQDARLLALEQDFEIELQILQEEFHEERERVKTQHVEEVQELNDIMAAVEAHEEEKAAEARQEHEQMMEEIRNKNLEEINVLRITLDSQIEDLEQHFETAHINYLQNTDQRTTDFKYLTSKDQELSREIEIKIRRIERLQSSLHHWRTKIAQNVKENAERNKMLMEERNAIQGHFQQLKARMNKFHDARAKRLSELTQNANGAKLVLKGQSEVAANVLKLSELARKMETDQEKVMPFYCSKHTAMAEAEVAAAMKSEKERVGMDGQGEESSPAEVTTSPLQSCAWTKPAGEATPIPVGKWNHLDNFFKKFNKVLLDKLCIEREEERLEAENAELRSVVKQYMDGISINDEVLGGSNPLLVINGKVNLTTSRPPVERMPPTQEATHLVATGRVAGGRVGRR
ncbi:unnamed protein product [Chrysoparadoxa australica]